MKAGSFSFVEFALVAPRGRRMIEPALVTARSATPDAETLGDGTKRTQLRIAHLARRDAAPLVIGHGRSRLGISSGPGSDRTGDLGTKNPGGMAATCGE
jgi:hypothetical protein